MIIVKWLESTAEFKGGAWHSDNKQFEKSLNIRVNAGELKPGYYPSIEEALLNLALEEYPGLEVIEGPQENDYSKIPDDAVF